MSRKWLQREGPKWVEQELISSEQLQNIQALYKQQKTGIGLLPLLASILIALSILTYIAANWQWFIPEVRLLVMLIVMTAFYAVGYRQYSLQRPNLGLGLISLGLVSFGGSLILLGQTYNLVTFHVGTFIIWGIAGALITYLFRSSYLFLITLLIFHIAQMYSVFTLHQFSFLTLALIVIGLGLYWWFDRQPLLTWLFTASVVVQSVLLVNHFELSALWVLVVFAGLYTVAESSREDQVRVPIQVISLAGAFIIALVLIVTVDEYFSEYSLQDWTAQWPLLFPLMAAIALAIYLKTANGRWSLSGYELLLFVPFVYSEYLYETLQANSSHILYLIVMFVFSVLLLLRGYDVASRLRVNIGTLLFLLTCFVAYTKLTWGFLPRSVFFLVGGLILFGLSWFLNRRRAKLFEQQEGGESDAQ